LGDHSFGASLIAQVGLDWSDAAIDARVREGTEIEFCATYMKKDFGALAEIVKAYGDNERRIVRALRSEYGRELTEDDRRAVAQFLLGERRG